MKQFIQAIIYGLAVYLSVLGLSYAETLYPLHSAKQTAQFHGLLKELRCLVCQNQDLADSNAPLAQDLKNEVYRLVQEGHSDDEIIQFLTDRYGEFILFKPPLYATTVVLWLGPMMFLLMGLWVLWRRTTHD